MAGLRAFTPALPVVVLAWRIRTLIRRFATLAATSAGSALPLTSLRRRRGPIFRRLERQGFIGTAGANRYYRDQESYRKWRATRRKRALLVLIAVAVALAAAWFAGWLQG